MNTLTEPSSNSTTFPADGGGFVAQFSYWFGHALFCATPSFWLAIMFGYRSYSAIAAMPFAVLSFVALYASVTSSSWYQSRHQSFLLGYAVRLGANIRSFVSLGGLITLIVFRERISDGHFSSGYFLLWPDLYSGMLAVLTVRGVMQELGIVLDQLGEAEEGLRAFLLTYLTTAVDGVILSGTLFVVVFCCLAVLAILRKTSLIR